MKCDAVAAVTRRSFEFDEASEKIMGEAIIDEVVWSSVIGASLHQKQRLPESLDKTDGLILLTITFFISLFGLPKLDF